jgi:uncharacterized protein
VASSFLAPILSNPERPWLLRNARSGACLATFVEEAFDSRTRNRGLLGRSSLPDGHALILAPCSSIHTFFMQFAIDVIFVARDGRVLKLAHAVPAWRIRVSPRAFAVVELPAGVIARTGTHVRDALRLSPD